MSKSSQRRISKRTPKTKVSMGTIAEFQRRLDAIQINLAKVWDEGFEAGNAYATADAMGRLEGPDPVNPYKDVGEKKS